MFFFSRIILEGFDMISVKNVSGSEVIWGGTIFSDEQERILDADFKATLSKDTDFYAAILSGNAEVYVDLRLVRDPIIACEYIRFEMKKDEDGNMISRIVQVPGTWGHRAKSLLYTTALAGSVIQECWPLEPCNECSLSFLKEENGVLVSCDDSESTYTKLVWAPTHKTMQKKAVLALPAVNANVRGWVGVQGLESYPQGKLYTGFNFINRTEWAIELMQPALMEYPFVLILRHPLGSQIQVELMFEYFTNFEVF
jgi:hypothetical protein